MGYSPPKGGWGGLSLLHHRFNNRFSEAEPCGQGCSQDIQQRADEQGNEEDGGAEEHFALDDGHALVEAAVHRKYIKDPVAPAVKGCPSQT